MCTAEILWAGLQTTAVKQIPKQRESNEFFGLPVHVKVTFTVYYSLLSVQSHYV